MTHTFVSFTDEVARLLELAPAPRSEKYVRQYDTDRVWMVWRYVDGGASVFLERPFAELMEGVFLRLEWHQSPDPVVVAAMIRAYQRGGERRRSHWLVRLLRWR
ncbi:hypothetical protein [Streptomyces sp. NPDC001635]